MRIKLFACGVAGAVLVASVALASSKPTSTSEPMRFQACVLSIDVVANKVGARPVLIVDTAIMKMVRFPTAEGSLLVTCSKPDGKRILTQSPHR